jgi:hypothetical protein
MRAQAIRKLTAAERSVYWAQKTYNKRPLSDLFRQSWKLTKQQQPSTPLELCAFMNAMHEHMGTAWTENNPSGVPFLTPYNMQRILGV